VGDIPGNAIGRDTDKGGDVDGESVYIRGRLAATGRIDE